MLGATGATGRLLAAELLERDATVHAIVRSADRLPRELLGHSRLNVAEGSVLSMDPGLLAEFTRGCESVACCLGHNLSLRGVFGPPWRLVTDSLRRVCHAVEQNQPATPVRLALMSSAGVRNRGQSEPVSAAHHAILMALRAGVPPHADNERAAELLRTGVGAESRSIEWVAVRPDSLTDEPQPTPTVLHESPTRSVFFNPGKTSRANVAQLMARLLTEDPLWAEWRGRMPVVYNAEG